MTGNGSRGERRKLVHAPNRGPGRTIAAVSPWSASIHSGTEAFWRQCRHLKLHDSLRLRFDAGPEL